MGWQSALLGGNVVSSYEHIDNLRNDVTAGKHWDSGETKYARIRHDGTNALLESSFGTIHIIPANGETKLYGLASHYATISHDGTNVMLSCDEGGIKLCPATGDISVLDASRSKSLILSHNGTNSIINSNNGMLILTPGGDNRKIQIGSDAASGSAFRIKDEYTGEWKRVGISNGAWSIVADT